MSEVSQVPPERDESYMEYEEESAPILLEPREIFDRCLVGFDYQDDRAVYDAAEVVFWMKELYQLSYEQAEDDFIKTMGSNTSEGFPRFIWTDVEGVLAQFNEKPYNEVNSQFENLSPGETSEKLNEFDELM